MQLSSNYWFKLTVSQSFLDQFVKHVLQFRETNTTLCFFLIALAKGGSKLEAATARLARKPQVW